MNNKRLKKLIDRILSNPDSPDDKEALTELLFQGQVKLATGQRSVAIAGNVSDAVIIVGDNNLIYKGANADAIRAIVEEILNSERVPALLTADEFAARAENSSIGGHFPKLVGRKALIKELLEQSGALPKVILLHGPGGIGKTRILVELTDILPEDVQLRYVRTEAESIEQELFGLDTNIKYVLVVDDAHRFSLLAQLRELLINPNLSGHVQLVLATRTVFKDSVLHQLAPPVRVQVQEINVGPLSNAEIDELIQSEPYRILDEHSRRPVLRVADGNPLFAGVAALLVRRGASLDGLSREQALVRYLGEVVAELSDARYGEKYIVLLEVLAALGTVDVKNRALHERLREVLGIDANQVDRMIGRLVGTGLIGRYGTRVKVSSEVIADHILMQHFFDPAAKKADYQTQVLEPFFAIQPKEILENLARAEIKAESLEAGSILGQKLEELLRIVRDGSNQDRLTILGWLDEVAYMCPNDALAILVSIVEGPEKPDEHYRDAVWGGWQVSHQMVLEKAVDLVEHTIYRGGLLDPINYLYVFATYQFDSDRYRSVRQRAQKKLQELAGFAPGKPFAVQRAVLKAASSWLDQLPEENFRWIMEILRPILKMEYTVVEDDPTDRHKVMIRQGLLPMNDTLRAIREQTIDLLFSAYDKLKNLAGKLALLQVLEEAVPTFMPGMHVPDEAYHWLAPDWVKIATFFSKTVITGNELPLIDAVSVWLARQSRYAEICQTEQEVLRAQLTDHRRYQVYRLLVGWSRRHDDIIDDWQQAEEKRRKALDAFLETIDLDTVNALIDQLAVIVEQTEQAGEYSLGYFDLLLRELGRRKPEIACRIIEQAVTDIPILKSHTGELLAGLRVSSPQLAWAYTGDWVRG